MATVGETSRPGYVYDSATDVWIPVGIGPHSHTPAAIGAISSSVVTTKGDLIVATGSGTVVRQGVGADGSYLVADSTQADGVTWAGPSTMAGRNAVLNSNFSIWQRGTSFSFAASTAYTSGYSADRWNSYTSANQASTISRQTTSDTTNLPNIQYCARFQRNSGQTGTTQGLGFYQSFESVNSIPLAGKTVTLSFYARAGANFSAASSFLAGYVYTGTGTDQNLNLPYTGAAYPVGANNFTLTNTWQRFTVSGTIATTATELGIGFYYTPTGTAGAADYFEITGVQLEHGSVATPYAPNGATYQAELAACQRYYFRQSLAAGATSGSAFGSAKSTTVATMVYSLPVTMRVAPTSGEHSNIRLWDGANVYTVTSSVFSGSTDGFGTADFGVASGLTQFRPYQIIANASLAGYVAFSAEL